MSASGAGVTRSQPGDRRSFFFAVADDWPNGQPPVEVPPTDIRITLERFEKPDPRRPTRSIERFWMRTRLGYHDGPSGVDIVVPPDATTNDFECDLTSTPDFFAWLVPRTGQHLPAALIHDGLVCDPANPTYLTYPATAIDRVTADRIFRDGMGGLGTSTVRRWLVWTAVTLATAWTDLKPRAWWRLRVIATLGFVAVLGVAATVDFFDVWDVLFWMGGWPWGDGWPWWAELLGGASGAIAIPAILGVLLWRSHRYRPVRAAGFLAGVALALLLHVTVAVLALTLLFKVVDKTAPRQVLKVKAPGSSPPPDPLPYSPMKRGR